MLNHFSSQVKDKHLFIANHFLTYGFGTDMPTLRYFSILEPIDRCIIMEFLISQGMLNFIMIDKLTMAYAKAGYPSFASEAVEYARQAGESEMNVWAYEQKAKMPVPKALSREERLGLVNQDRQGAQTPLHHEFLDKIEFFLSNELQ